MHTSSTNSRPQVHGHRGCRGLRPENTLPAFLHAIELGVDVLELDVLISHDRQVVVAHDPWLPAVLGTGPKGEPLDPRPEQAPKLYQLPYATIRQCALGLWPDSRFPGQIPVPTYRPLLREVLLASQQACQRLGRPPVGFSVEIKSTSAGDGVWHPGPQEFVELVLAELQACQASDLTTILSFDVRVLRAVRQQQPTQRLCLLLENKPVAPEALALGFVPEVLGPDFALLSGSLIQEELRYRCPALQLVLWTVNSLPDLQEVLSWQPDGITTDYPDRLLCLLNGVT